LYKCEKEDVVIQRRECSYLFRADINIGPGVLQITSVFPAAFDLIAPYPEPVIADQMPYRGAQ